MKKLLALVLALVMTLSLCITSNAAFAGEEYDYDEAVEVMAAVGVFQGDENGKFNGKQELTREQAAKLVAYLDLGEKVAEALPAVKVFNDVEATRWSAKYVAYCADAGYLAGVGNGNFDPAGKLTGYAFGKMLLCALGYDATVEQFTGTNWSIKVAALMQSNDIAKGVSGSASAALTREEAAQYCFNALKATCVKYDNNSVIKVGDVEIKQSTKATPVDSGDKGYGDSNLQLLEKLYGTDLKFAEETISDDLGCPAERWTYKSEKVGVYATAADEIVVSDDEYDDVIALYVDAVDDDYSYNYEAENAKTLTVVTNKTGDDTEEVGYGDVVRFYLDSEDVITKAVITEYKLGKITKVDTKVSKVDAEDDVTAYLNVEDFGNKVKDTDIAGFDADTYVKGAYILYAVGQKDATIIADSAIAETVEGKVASMKSSKATIDGTAYKVLSSATVALNDEGTFYLNKAGQIIFADVESESDNYALVYATKVEANKVSSTGVKGTVVTVYLVDAEGTLASYTADLDVVTEDDDDTRDPGVYFAGTDMDVNEEDQFVCAYSVNADDEFVVEKEKDSINPGSGAINKSAANGTDSSTEFVFAYADGSKMKTKTATGYKNVSVASDATYWTVSDDGDVLFVFVNENNGTLSSDVQYAVVLDSSATKTKDSDKNVFSTYAVAVDGEETTLTFKNLTTAEAETLTDGAVFAFTMDGDNAKLDDATIYTVAAYTEAADNAGDIAKLNDDYVVFDLNPDEQYNLDGVEVYEIVMDYDEDGLDNVTVSAISGSDVDVADIVGGAYVKDGTDLDILFVVTALLYE